MKVTIDLLATDELDYLDEFLMSRLDEDNASESLDEGNDYSILLEISTLCRKVLCIGQRSAISNIR